MLKMDHSNTQTFDNEKNLSQKSSSSNRDSISSTNNIDFLEPETNDNNNIDINQPLTAELLAEQNELYSSKLLPKPNAIRAWAADLPEVPDTVQPILTTSHIFEMESLSDIPPQQIGRAHV